MSDPKKSTLFGQKVNELSDLISSTSTKVSDKEGKSPMVIIGGLAVPLVIFGALFFAQPGFVKEAVAEGEDPASAKKSNTKVFYWTVLFTVVIWILMYIYMYCSGSYTSK